MGLNYNFGQLGFFYAQLIDLGDAIAYDLAASITSYFLQLAGLNSTRYW
jgi:hypothetical protein